MTTAVRSGSIHHVSAQNHGPNTTVTTPDIRVRSTPWNSPDSPLQRGGFPVPDGVESDVRVLLIEEHTDGAVALREDRPLRGDRGGASLDKPLRIGSVRRRARTSVPVYSETVATSRSAEQGLRGLPAAVERDRPDAGRRPNGSLNGRTDAEGVRPSELQIASRERALVGVRIVLTDRCEH